MPESQALHGVPLFEGMEERELARRGLHVSTRVLPAGAELFSSGDQRQQVWFVRSGWIQMTLADASGLEATVELAGKGRMVGYATDFKHATHFCTARAMTDSVVVGVPVRAFEHWATRDPKAAGRVIDGLNVRLVDAFELKVIGSEPSPRRLRLVLLWLHRRFGAKLPITRGLLADLTGLRPETCSRGLSALRRRGVLRVLPRVVEVLKPDALRA